MRQPARLLITWIALAAATAHAGEKEVVVRPVAGLGPLENPLKGWCPYTDAGPIHQPYSMVFLYVPWKELEPAAGRFAFDDWEQRAWSAPLAKGKHVVLRVYADYPSRPTGLPSWLEQTIKTTPYRDHGGGTSPDYDDPKTIAAMERLIEAMGARYNRNPRVAFIELGLLGFWGEWHTWPSDALYATPQTERLVIDAYHRAFPDKILMARTAKNHAGAQTWLGFHDDLFPEDTDNGQSWSFLARIRASGRQTNWERAAIGGEMVPFQAKAWLGDGFQQTLHMLEQAHFSWVGPYCPALEDGNSGGFRQRGETLVRQMGYQFRLTEIRHQGEVARGDVVTVNIRGENEGVAPFYYPWATELALLDDAGNPATRIPLPCDIRTWLPGAFAAEARFEVAAAPGRYQLAVGIIDPWTRRPAIRFANTLRECAGWTVISDLLVRAAD